MPLGRCSGCGETDSPRKISLHVLSCDRYLDVYASHPDCALDPVAEFERFRSEDDSPEARARRRGERLQARFAEINHWQAASTSRWRKPSDILD